MQQQAPIVIRTHCAAHQLNLAVVSSCKIGSFKNVESYIGEISRFFIFSPKKTEIARKSVNLVSPSPSITKLKDACHTRWVQCTDSYIVFLELLPAVHVTLPVMICPCHFENLGTDWRWIGETLTTANGFHYQIVSSSFLVIFRILLEVLSCLRGLTLKLQMLSVDVLHAYEEANCCILFKGSEQEFNKNTKANKLGNELHGKHFGLCQP